MNGKRVMKTKQPVALVALLVLLCCTVAGTLAYLVTSTGPVTNTFTPAEVKTEVTESFENDKNGTLTKSNVQIKNNGNIDAYIRAAIIVNWANDAGEISGTPVKDSDYEMDLNIVTTENPNAPWFQGTDGYYYCKASVAPNGSTPALIDRCIQKGTAPEGFYLQVTILADGIQSVPDTVVKDVWKVVEVKGGQLAAVGTNG